VGAPLCPECQAELTSLDSLIIVQALIPKAVVASAPSEKLATPTLVKKIKYLNDQHNAAFQQFENCYEAMSRTYEENIDELDEMIQRLMAAKRQYQTALDQNTTEFNKAKNIYRTEITVNERLTDCIANPAAPRSSLS
jgi:hypothetical protein